MMICLHTVVQTFDIFYVDRVLLITCSIIWLLNIFHIKCIIATLISHLTPQSVEEFKLIIVYIVIDTYCTGRKNSTVLRTIQIQL